MVYSITDYNSFKSLTDKYIDYYKKSNDNNNMKVMLIGNDSENENSRDVPKHEAEFLANQYNMLF